MSALAVISLSFVAGSAPAGTAAEPEARATAVASGPVAPAATQTGTRQPAGACKSAKKAVRFYAARIAYWRTKMGAPNLATHRGSKCPRYLARVLRVKAHVAKVRYVQWLAYHWAWEQWLPAKWQRIARCETGGHGGTGPGGSVWEWNSGKYQGAFGFAVSTWDQYKPRGAPSEAYLATPRQQYQCALNVYALFGYGAWGCGGA